MGNLLEQLYMDINNYCESSIRIGDTDLELFLSPFYANPQKINNWDVPVAIAPLETMKRRDWDVTLYKVSIEPRKDGLFVIQPRVYLLTRFPQICSFINGVNHVRKIAELAEVDLHLARQSIQHLVYATYLEGPPPVSS